MNFCDCNEHWKPIQGWETRYQISSKGRVKSNESTTPIGINGAMKHNPSKILKPGTNKGGYKVIRLSYKRIKKETRSIHRLVALHFIPNPNDLPTVDHTKFNKDHNCVCALEWITQEEQNRRTREASRHNPCKGEDNNNKLTESEVIDLIKYFNTGIIPNQSALADQYEVSVTQINKIYHGKAWKHLRRDYTCVGKSTRMSLDTAKDIVDMIKSTDFVDSLIGSKFGVSRETVRDIRLGKRFKKLTNGNRIR